MSHPTTDGRSLVATRGWICSPPGFGRKAFSGWTEHGMCEMWIGRGTLPSKQANKENLKRVFVKMHRALKPFNDEHSALIGLVNHAETLVEQL